MSLGFKKKLYVPPPKEPFIEVEVQRTKNQQRIERVDDKSLECQVRQLLANKISGNQTGIWLLVAEHLRLGSWDLLCGWSGQPASSVYPRMAMHLVHEAALCTVGTRYGRCLSQRGFEVANGLPWVPADSTIHQLLNAHTVAEAQALQVALGKLRRAHGHFQGQLLAIDPHRMHSWSKRQMRRHRFKENEPARKMAQGFFLLDADTQEPVCFTLASSSQTVSQATPTLLGMAADILGSQAEGSLLLADTEYYTAQLLDHVHLQTPFEILVPMALRGRSEVPDPSVCFTHHWPGYATAMESFSLHNSCCPHPYFRYIERSGENPQTYSYKNFLSTAERDVLADLCAHYPKRWHIEEFFKNYQALGWKRSGTLNLNIRYAQMSFALLAQAAISQMRQRLGPPFDHWDATHLARDLFRGLDGDIRVQDDTILLTYYNAPNHELLRYHYQNLPQKLSSEGVDPHIPWLYNFKLDFRFA